MYTGNEDETIQLEEEVGKCESVEDLKKRILPLLSSQKTQFATKFEQVLEKTGYSVTEFSKLCKVSRTTINNWHNGAIPKNRETFLVIGIIAGFTEEEMNEWLTKYGRYPKLYAKTKEDVVCSFVLKGEYGKEAIEKYRSILDEIDKVFDEKVDLICDITTERFDAELSKIDDPDEFKKFIIEKREYFSSAYRKFYSAVKVFYRENFQYENYTQTADGQGWSSSLRQCVSAINQNKWYPTRNKIISLGLHLSMNHEMINQLLVLAQMSPLYSKNLFECIIIYILESASITNIMVSSQDNLYQYASDVFEELEIPEFESFISELSGKDEYGE